MSFFEPRPAAPPPEDPQHFAYPWQEPENALPGFGGAAVTLVRNDTTALQLSLAGAYPQGLALTLRARLHPDHLVDRWWGPPYGGPFDDLRFGLSWPDGRRVEAGEGWQPQAGTDSVDGFTLTPGGGGGGGLTYEWRYWLWPLPPPGPATVHLWWERRGIVETAVAVDLTPFVAAADDAMTLWLLPDPPSEAGWMAYAPLQGGGAYFSTLRVADDAAAEADEPTVDADGGARRGSDGGPSTPQ